MVRFIARAQGVFPVPGEGEQAHPVPAQLLHLVQTRPQQRAVFHREEQGGFLLRPGRFHLPRGGADLGQGGKLLPLPLKAAAVEAVIPQGLLRGQAVGNEHGAALAPAGVCGDFAQGEVGTGIVQGVPAAQGTLKGGEGVAVQVDHRVAWHGEPPSIQHCRIVCFFDWQENRIITWKGRLICVQGRVPWPG